MRFLLDANLPARLTNEFVDAGHECTHIENLLPRYSPDTQIAQIANQTGAVLISRDADFLHLARIGLLTAPFVWLRLGNLRRAAIGTAIKANLPTIVAAIQSGETLVIVR